MIDKIHESGDFSPTNFNARSVVEISADRKSDGWFFHAVTGEEWLLKLKFRTSKSTFRRESLVETLDLKPLNEMRDLPVYGTEPRVKCKNLRGPWQEVQLQVHSWNEIDKPAFWKFLEDAVSGFTKFTDKVETSRERPNAVVRCSVRNGTSRGRAFRPARKSPGKRKCSKNCASYSAIRTKVSFFGTISNWCTTVSGKE